MSLLGEASAADHERFPARLALVARGEPAVHRAEGVAGQVPAGHLYRSGNAHVRALLAGRG
ncbi:hypothetical protein OG749_21010 [Streptomyces nojiriensis]|uniref:hypothetical protein n=1 Tax=Streptomyces nojiriensis TaxID=66374 RepID=UPI002E194AD4